MRRALAAGAVVVLIGGGGTYALLRNSATPKSPATQSTVEAPHVETVRLFAAPASAPPASDLIATKLASQPTVWPDLPKPVVKPKLQQAAKTATAAKVKSKPVVKPKLKKPATDATLARR
jgi:hypothetical protein